MQSSSGDVSEALPSVHTILKSDSPMLLVQPNIHCLSSGMDCGILAQKKSLVLLMNSVLKLLQCNKFTELLSLLYSCNSV